MPPVSAANLLLSEPRARPPLLRYGVACLAVILALLFTLWLPPIRAGTPFLPFVLAVTLSTLFGGLAVGLFALALSTVVELYWVLPPYHDFRINSWQFAQLLTFFGVSGITTSLVYSLQAAHRREFAQRESLRITLLGIGDAVIATDPEGRITQMNAVAAALTGWPVEEAYSHPVEEVLELVNEQTGAVVENPVRRVLADGRMVGLANHTLLVARNGVRRPIDDNAAPLRDATGRLVGAVLVFRDITERREVEDALQHLNATLEEQVRRRTAELERSNRELSDFAYVASHDLKAPLRAIIHLANWVGEDAGAVLPPTAQAHLVKLQQRAQRMERLLDDLLSYSRAGRVYYRPEEVDTGALVQDIVLLESPPDGFIVEVDPALPLLVTERTPLETVLRNLIGNAIKHHHQPECGRVVVTAQTHDGFAEFAVTDDGPGIAPEHHVRIFRIFQTLRPRDQIEGSGMGLTLVKRLVESRGGVVRLESTPGAGTTFRFTWPKNPPTPD